MDQDVAETVIVEIADVSFGVALQSSRRFILHDLGGYQCVRHFLEKHVLASFQPIKVAFPSIPDFAVRILFQSQYIVTSVVVYISASDEKQLAVEGIVFVDGEISFPVVDGHYQIAIFPRG